MKMQETGFITKWRRKRLDVSDSCKIISIPDKELFSETYVGYTASYFV